MHTLLLFNIQESLIANPSMRKVFNEVQSYLYTGHYDYTKIIMYFYSAKIRQEGLITDPVELEKIGKLHYNADEYYYYRGNYVNKLNVHQGDIVSLAGFDTDSAILLAAFMLSEKGVNFKVLSKSCFSTNGATAHSNALKLMQLQFPGHIMDSKLQ